jgi:hypothetical protein
MVAAGMGLVLMLAGAPGSVAQVSRPTHASGRIVVSTIDQTSSDTSSTLTMVDAVVSVRMRRVGAQWVDAGSSFQYSWDQDSVLEECSYNMRSRWHEHARFDAVEQGSKLNMIELELDDRSGLARLQLYMRGRWFWEGFCNPPGPEAREDAARDGIECDWARNECLMLDDGLRTPRVNPSCPMVSAALVGTIEAGGRIDFSCQESDRERLEEYDETRYLNYVRVTGYLRLTP